MESINNAATAVKEAVVGKEEPKTEAEKAKSTVDDVGDKGVSAAKEGIETADKTAKDAQSSAQGAVDAGKEQIQGAADAVSNAMEDKK